MAYYMENEEVEFVTRIIASKFSNDVQMSLARESERLRMAQDKARKEHTEVSFKAVGKVAYGIEMYLKALQDSGVYNITDYQMHKLVRYYQMELPALMRGKE